MLALNFIGFAVYFAAPDLSPLIEDRSVEVTQWHKKVGQIDVVVGPGSTRWVSSEQVSKHFINALIIAEDARFYMHRGVDPIEIVKSIKTNWQSGRFARGASTITQQVVKLAILSRKKTLRRKILEMLGAMSLETKLSKQEILSWYINLIEFGDGTYGIYQASQHYFQTKPHLLTATQAVHLALVLPSPNSWSAGLRKKDLTSFGMGRFSQIAARMRRADYITDQEYEHMMATGNFGSPISGYPTVERLSRKH